MRLLYNFGLHTAALLAGPVLLPWILTAPRRRMSVPRRLSLILPDPRHGVAGGRRRIWVHALSVGETLSAVPLVAGLRDRHPKASLVVSASTQTGFDLAEARLARFTDARLFFPFDLLPSVRRTIRRVAPDLVVLVETDLWPNILADLARRGVPAVLVNGRLSDRTAAGYRRLAGVMGPALASLSAVCAQSAEDARRYVALGVPPDRVTVTGSLKFDIDGEPLSEADKGALREFLGAGPDVRVVVAGSTHEGEETLLAEAFHRLKGDHPTLFPVVVPRDPARADAVAGIFSARGFRLARLTAIEADPATGAIDGVVVDRIGRLQGLYGAADAAVVGGSFVPLGGHNPLEPAVLAVPVLFGAYMDAFREISASLLSAGGAVRVADAAGIVSVLGHWLARPEAARAVGAAGRQAVLAQRGAVDRTLAVIDRWV